MFGATVTLSLILQDYRIAFVVLGFTPCGVWSTLGDAMPSGMRRRTSILGPGLGVTLLMILQIGLFMKLIAITEVTYSVGNITFTCSNLATSCITNIAVFWSRNVVTAILNPKGLTVIKSSVESVKISKIEARVLYAAFNIKEAAQHLQDEEMRVESTS